MILKIRKYHSCKIREKFQFTKVISSQTNYLIPDLSYVQNIALTAVEEKSLLQNEDYNKHMSHL